MYQDPTFASGQQAGEVKPTRLDCAKAVVEENCLGKRTPSTRKLSLQRLPENAWVVLLLAGQSSWTRWWGMALKPRLGSSRKKLRAFEMICRL